jgi:hypothetical protein
MKLIVFRGKIDIAILSAALTIAIMPIIGLLSGTAISVGLYGANYQEISLQDNPGRYWFIIKVELAVVLWILALSLFRFPVFEQMHRQITLFEEKNKIFFISLMYLGVPVIATFLIVFVVALL